MASTDRFAAYVEALNALGSIEQRQRDALRKAVEAASAAEQTARTQVADQQRMYDRAGQDASQAERLLGDLRGLLGDGGPPTPAPASPAGPPPPLQAIRGQLRDVAEWAMATKPVVESLLRTKGRLAAASHPTVGAAAAAAAPPAQPAPPVRRAPAGVIAAVAVLVLVIVAVVLLTAH